MEVNLRDLKITLGMDVLKSQTVAGVRKEVLLFGLAFNLVRRVMQAAADRQQVMPDRISFIDAMRWLCRATPRESVPQLIVVPGRPGRWDPRVRKRRPKQYDLMNQPRYVLKQRLEIKRLAA